MLFADLTGFTELVETVEPEIVYQVVRPLMDDLVTIAATRKLTLAALVAEIDATRPRDANLSSALRLYVLDWAKRGERIS